MLTPRQTQLAQAAILDYAITQDDLTPEQLARLEAAYRDPTPAIARAAVERMRDRLRAEADELDALSKEQ